MHRGPFRGETCRNTVPIVRAFRNAKNALGCRILHMQSENLSSVSGAWIQTPVSAWLASVRIVSLLRNDHCYAYHVVMRMRKSYTVLTARSRNADGTDWAILGLTAVAV